MVHDFTFYMHTGQAAGQIYTYPTKPWKKKKGPPPSTIVESPQKDKPEENLGG